MSIQEPAWLKRTRPCPFFSQGRCLFADSCNFLHDVKVRSGVNQPLLSTTVKQPPLPPKPVFHPPSVVVNSASPGSVNLASPQSPVGTTQNSSRYSGLLSVLSDVIGPLSNPPTADDAVPPRTVSAISSSFRSAVHGRTGLPSESDPVVAGFEPTSDASGIETDQSAPRHAELPSILEPDSETTSVDPFGHQMGCFPPAADDALLAEFLPVPDHEESGDGDATSYFVETYIIEPPEAKEEGHEDEDMGGCGEDDPAVMVSNRQSTFSSFTGASLLASPRHSIFEDGASPIEDHSAVDLLSPVQLSTKLRPFPVPPLGSRVKRGDSIDSGYADGDSWGPLPFPRSPPGSFRPPVTFPSHSGRASLSFSSLKARRVSYDAIALRPPPYNPTEVTKEVDNSEDNEDTKYTILGAYAMSPSGEQGEGGACDPLQVNAVGEMAKEDDRLPSEVPAVVRSPWRYSPKHLHPTRNTI
ncbi:hypothetical protein HD554DRAFT_159948 [Boletus coccyginus]|nr:hypothetical protein HD554DRAFT_159948 [Boletus coccyginus]